MARDPLRSTLDNLSVDPEAASDRPYLEAALRRMGYSEQEIQHRLGAPVAPAPEPTEYRLVKLVTRASTGPGSTSPFEDLTSNFEEVPDVAFEEMQPTEFDEVKRGDEDLSFEEVIEAPAESDEVRFPQIRPADEPIEEEVQPIEEEVQFEELGPGEEAPGKPRQGLSWEETQQQELAERQAADDAELLPGEEVPLDQIGQSPDSGGERTRVRVRRVRAGSRQEAEDKVKGGGRRVIKSIPVDIVERWGQAEPRPAKEDRK